MKTCKRLYQWDINQKMVDVKGHCVDFVIDDETVYRVEASDGECAIPNELLQKPGSHVVYECFTDGTRTETTVNVRQRPVPPNYIFTPTEQETFDDLVDKVNGLIDDFDDIVDSKQDVLVSGTNIKTINGKSILGSGNLVVEGGGSGGVVYSAGDNIEISDDYVISAIVPENTSDLTNDSGFITEDDIPTIPSKTSDLENDSSFITSNDIPTIPNKTSELTNDSGFITSSDIPSIPSKTSDLTNDSGYITSSDIPSIPSKTSDLTNDSGFITSADIPSIPSKTSQLTNDSDFTTTEAVAGQLDTKQDTLVSGTNIKTVNGNSLLGEGNIVIQGGGSGVADVKINETSILDENSVANIPIADNNCTLGLVKLSQSNFYVNNQGFTIINYASESAIDNRNNSYYQGRPITVDKLDYTLKKTMCDGQGATWTTAEQQNALARLGITGIPSKTSDLTNDSGFITADDIPAIPNKTSDLENDSNFITSSDIPAIPSKTSDLTNDSGFITSSDIPTIPSKTSELTNDSNFITSSDVPSKTSDLQNDSGFITANDMFSSNVVTVSSSAGTVSKLHSYKAGKLVNVNFTLTLSQAVSAWGEIAKLAGALPLDHTAGHFVNTSTPSNSGALRVLKTGVVNALGSISSGQALEINITYITS